MERSSYLRCTLCEYGQCRYKIPKANCSVPKYEVPVSTTKPPGTTVKGRRKRYKRQFTFKEPESAPEEQ